VQAKNQRLRGGETSGHGDGGDEPLRSRSSRGDHETHEWNGDDGERELVNEPADEGEQRERGQRGGSRSVGGFESGEREQGAREAREQWRIEASGRRCGPERQ